MQLFEGYSADELHRVLTTSRWIAGLLLLLAFGAVALNQWLVYRIATQQKLERDSGKSRLIAAEDELRRLRGQISTVASAVDKLTSTRKLSAGQVAELKRALATAEKGPLIITYLTIEWEAEEYAKQLARILEEVGYTVALSDHLWVNLEHNGLTLTSRDGVVPKHGIDLGKAFSKIGIEAPITPPGEVATELDIPKGHAVLVVGGQ